VPDAVTPSVQGPKHHRLLEGVELAFSLEQNEYQGNTYLELRVEDFR
jgi:hypothetical protein